MRPVVPIAAALMVSACVPTPDYYSIPPQHSPSVIGTAPVAPSAPAATTTEALGEMFVATAPNADQYVVRDIRALEGEWRWSLAEPELRFRLPAGELRRKFRLEAGVNDRTFRDTGPLKVVILINGNQFDQITFQNFGDQTYEKPVPASFLIPGAENRVVMRVLNPWKAPDPGVKLGFVIRSAGFVTQ